MNANLQIALAIEANQSEIEKRNLDAAVDMYRINDAAKNFKLLKAPNAELSQEEK